MQIDNALILSAGFGTRMGKIGRKIPKVTWPIFNKTLLELQVHYLKEVGVRQIFINLHHQKDLILESCLKNSLFKDVIFLEEESILGVGGAVHNLARHESVNYKGRLLIVNADQFCFFDKIYWEQAYSLSENHSCALFATRVEKRFQYNETLLNSEGYLSRILPKGEQTAPQHLTYSGFGFINLEKIIPHEGASDFFQAVADYKNKNIPMISLPIDFEYWDFGTKERYFEQMLKLKTSTGEFKYFLNRVSCMNEHQFYYDDKEKNIKALLLDNSNHEVLSDLNAGQYIVANDFVERIEI